MRSSHGRSVNFPGDEEIAGYNSSAAAFVDEKPLPHRPPQRLVKQISAFGCANHPKSSSQITIFQQPVSLTAS